jgi:hypothetical protein
VWRHSDSASPHVDDRSSFDIEGPSDGSVAKRADGPTLVTDANGETEGGEAEYLRKFKASLDSAIKALKLAAATYHGSH